MNRRSELSAQSSQVPKLLFKRSEAAYSLGISIRSVDSMIADGRLKTRRWGSRVLIPASELQRVADRIVRQDDLRGQGDGGVHAKAS